MTRLSIPTARRRGAIGALRRAWTAPTNLIGHATGPDVGLRQTAAHRRRGDARVALLPARRTSHGWRAVAIGHVVIVEPALLARHGRWLLAHELSHARQHDWLGPAYLPAHAMLLALSAAMSLIRPRHSPRHAKLSPWHAYNPLERVLIDVPIDAVVRPPEGALADDVLQAYGLL